MLFSNPGTCSICVCWESSRFQPLHTNVLRVGQSIFKRFTTYYVSEVKKSKRFLSNSVTLPNQQVAPDSKQSKYHSK